MGRIGNVYKMLFGKPEGKTPLGRPWLLWEYNIKMDFRKVVLESVSRISFILQYSLI
jgi:hypothetical protein